MASTATAPGARAGTTGTRGRAGMVVAGVIAIVAGIAAAVVLVLVGQARVEDAVERLARAPSGCDTTLDVDDEGRYLLFVETQGAIDELAGGCDFFDEYTIDGQLPRVRVELADPGGDEVDLDRVGDVTYDAGGFAGTAIRQVDLEQTGRYVLRVESDVDVVVSVGRDPADATGPFPALAVVAALLGVVLGVVLLIVAMRRRRPAAVLDAPAPTWWQPVGSFPPAGPPQVPPPGPPIAGPGPASPWARPTVADGKSPPRAVPGPAAPPSGAWPPPPTGPP